MKNRIKKLIKSKSLCRIGLRILQPLFKQNAYILFDTKDVNTQLLDNLILFKEMQKQNIKCYYLCYKKHPQYKELKREYKNKIIGFNRIESLHYRLFFKMLKTKAIIESFHCLNFAKFKKLSKRTKLIFSQHGINFFKGDFIFKKCLNSNTYDKAIISNDFEKNMFKTHGNFAEEDLIKAGLIRWDILKFKKKPNNNIFVYFTFRGTFVKKKNIKDSIYYKNLILLLKKIKKIKNTKINIAIHHETRKLLGTDFLSDFNLIEESEIGKIKNKSDLLITDYSSMSFDFLIKNKPVIFYRLDFKDSFLLERDKAIQDFAKKNKIFNTFYNIKSTMKKIKSYVENDFKLEKQYIKEAKNFFYFKRNISNIIINKLESL